MSFKVFWFNIIFGNEKRKKKNKLKIILLIFGYIINSSFSNAPDCLLLLTHKWILYFVYITIVIRLYTSISINHPLYLQCLSFIFILFQYIKTF